MPDKIHLTVATIIHHRGKYLLVREIDNGREVINQPAGHVEPGETLQQAAVRETLEETGWQVELTGLLGLSHCKSTINGKNYHRVSFVAKPVAKIDNAELDSDIIEVLWLDSKAIFESDQLRSPLVAVDINKHIKNNIYPLDIITNIKSELPG